MIIKYLFYSRTLRFVKFYLVFIRSMQFKKKFEQSLAGLEQDSAGLEQGFEGSNRVLLTTWVRTRYCGVHGRMAPPPSMNLLPDLQTQINYDKYIYIDSTLLTFLSSANNPSAFYQKSKDLQQLLQTIIF